jgi:integrase
MVMDDPLMDAAERVLFATVGYKRQEYPMLMALREFLKAYLAAKPVVEGQDLASIGDQLGLSCTKVFEYTTRCRDELKPFLAHDAYRDAIMRAGSLLHARLDRAMLSRVVPPDWDRIIAALIADGPQVAAARAQTAIYEYSLKRVPANRRRPAGPRAAATVRHVHIEARRLFRLVYQLRAHPACGQWTHMPELALPSMPQGGYEVLAPRIEVVRQTLSEMNREIHARLKISSIEEEIPALALLSDEAVLAAGLWYPMRDRLLLMLLSLTAARKSALARLRREDYIADHVGPPPDCRRGAVLELRPQKTKDRDEVRRKPLPQQAALIVEGYLQLMDRFLAARGEPPATPSSPLLVSRPANCRLVPQPKWIYLRIAGKLGLMRPLILRDARQLPKHVSAEDAPYCGYTPHELRHFSNQIAEIAGDRYNKQHPATGGENNPPVAYYAAALLDNGGAEDKMRALYGGRRAPAMLEVVAGRAAEGAWEILMTGAGLRKRPDLEAYERELIRLRQIEDEERRLAGAANKLQAKRVRSGQLALPPGENDRQDRLGVLVRRQEGLIALVEELKEELLESAAITHQAVRLSRQKADTIKKLDLYRLDQATWLEIPDSEPPGAEKVDWEAIDKGKLGKPLMPSGGSTAVRDWLTFREFCAIADIGTRSTLTRWAKGEHLPARADRRPWAPEWAPVDDSLGLNYRRIWVPGVNEAFWRTRLRREALAHTLSHWPREQGWTTKGSEPTPRCLEPIRLPAQRLRRAA